MARRRGECLRLGFAWSVANVLIPVSIYDFFWQPALSRAHQLLLYFALLGATALEVLLFVMIVGGIKAALKSEHFRLPRLLLSSAVVLVTAFYIFAVCLSLTLFWLRGFLVTPDIVRAFWLSPIQILRHLTASESIAASLGGLGALIAAIWAFRTVSEYRGLPDARRTFCFAAVLFGLVFASLNVAPRSAGGRRDESSFRSLARGSVGPNLSLVWAPLAAPPSFLMVPDMSIYDEPRLSNEDYLKLIKDPKPTKNIVVIMVEALRADVIDKRVNGRTITPTLNRLAAGGLHFKRVYAQSTDSAYSEASLFSSLFPLKFHSRDDFTYLNYPVTRFYEPFALAGYAAGYFTSANEEWQNLSRMTYSPMLHTFFDATRTDEGHFQNENHDVLFANAVATGRLKTGKVDDAVTTRHALDWMTSVSRTKPFFLAMNYQSSHFPYQQGMSVPEVFKPADLEKGSFLWYPPSIAPVMRNRYWNSLAYIDGQIEKVVAALEQAGLLQKTVIVVVGDHGELFHEHSQISHSGFPYEDAARVPLIIYGAGDFSSVDPAQPVALLDVAPTLLALAGLPQHPHFQGRALLLPEAEGGADRTAVSPVFITVQALVSSDAVVFGPWKYARNYSTDRAYLFNLIHDQQEAAPLNDRYPELTSCFERLLEELRSRQLYYYEHYALHSRSSPPRLPDLDPHCRSVAAAAEGSLDQS